MARLPRARLLSACLLLLLCPAGALAQTLPIDQTQAVEPGMDAPAHVAFVDGVATLEREGQPDAAPLNMPLLAGDRLRTANGRVEILFGDGSVLHLDTATVVDFQSDELVRLLAGRVRLEIPGPERPVSYRIDAPFASAEITRSGEYRLGMAAGDRGSEIELAVVRGAAELVNEQGRTPLVAGERAFARAEAAPSYAYVYNSAAWDAFDQWSEARRDERLGVSSQYLPESVRPYAASFDQYGSWRYASSYGYVWYPRVEVGWRPYYNGRWATLRPYGWTWIGADPWAWPTHHYGRWGFSAGLWFWIPGRTWGPAWVSWAYAPGYVSWCPLGWNNRAVIQIGAFSSRGYDPWRAWTVVPQRHFNTGYVNVRRVGHFDLDARTRTAFTQGTRAPGYAGRAVPRGSVPIHTAGTTRRAANSPLYTNLGPGDSRVSRAPSRTIVGSSPVDTGGRSAARGAAAPNAARAPLARSRAGTPMGAAGDRRAAERATPRAQDRSAYGRIERTPSPGSAPSAPSARRGVDMGVGGGSPAARPRSTDAPSPGYGRSVPGRTVPSAPAARRGADRGVGGPPASARPPSAVAPAPGYGRPLPNRRAPAAGGSVAPGRAMPRGRGDAPSARSAAPSARSAAPSARSAAPASRAPRASAPPRASRPAASPRGGSSRGSSSPRSRPRGGGGGL